MDTAVSPLPDDVEALKALLSAAIRRAEEAEAQLANAQARVSATEAMIAHIKLQIAKLRRERYGPSAERTRRLLEQMELQLEDLEADACEDDLAAEVAVQKTTKVTAFERKRPARKPFPEHLPRERVIIPAPCSCPACGSVRLSKLGEDVTETLEVIPRQWKVIQTVREKFSCRDCEKITQPPAPFHVVPRGWAGPSFLSMVLFEKYGQHQPLNRQADRFAREGVPLSVSTLADQVGAAAFALMPLYRLIEAHVLAAERLHGDDTTVPVMAKSRTDIARLWVYVRDDRPFAGADPPAALFYYSRDRRGEHSQAHLASWSGILQADAYAGYNELYVPIRQPGAILEAGCFAHARRKFFVLADVAAAARKKSRGEQAGKIYPIALEAVQKIDALFDIERAINGKSPAERIALRQEFYNWREKLPEWKYENGKLKSHFMKENITAQKSIDFAIKVIQLNKELPEENREYVISKQLLRSGTAIGALIREVEHAESKPDFLHKMNIALKEANETGYWLLLLFKGNYLTESVYNAINKECLELIKLLVSTVKTTKTNLGR